MKTKRILLGCIGVVLGLTFLITSDVSLAGPPGSDNLAVTALPSFGSAGSVSPTVPGNATNQWFYAFCLASGSSFNQTFPVQYQLSDTDGTNPETININFNPAGNPTLSGATTASGFSITDNNVTQTNNIVVSTGVLADGVYNLNVQIQGTPQNQVQLSHDTIHVQVLVGAGCSHSCFFTDSSFNLLTDCGGNPVSSSSGGTFAIVGNPKGRVVATNPGQFYYNLVWTNSGNSQTVTINLSSTNLNPHGANAVHAMVFNSSGFVADLSNWDMVNEDGTPCGPSGPCSVSVPAGHVLWVTWHLTYAGIGSPSAGISSTCPGNVTVSATGTLTDNSNSTLYTCTTTATGYLK